MFRHGNYGRFSPGNLGALPTDPALAALAGLRVLVVDDNALNREVASEFLQAVRMQVVLAANGLQALDCLAQGDIDMVLMDLQMPVMDGLAASREIRKQARWACLPLIALSAHDAQGGQLATVAAGMDAYLGKPIDEAALYQTLLQFVPPATETPLPDMLPGLDLRLAVARLGGRPASLQRVLRGFVRDFAHLSAQWLPPVGPPPRQTLGRQAHILKSTARYLGADPLASRDGLTGIANRRSFDESLKLVCQLTARRKESLRLAMMDVDFFKQFNDRYGHPVAATTRPCCWNRPMPCSTRPNARAATAWSRVCLTPAAGLAR